MGATSPNPLLSKSRTLSVGSVFSKPIVIGQYQKLIVIKKTRVHAYVLDVAHAHFFDKPSPSSRFSLRKEFVPTLTELFFFFPRHSREYLATPYEFWPMILFSNRNTAKGRDTSSNNLPIIDIRHHVPIR
jgi:hypothetical protein